MKKKYFLSKAEMDIMNLFWGSQGRGIRFKELMEYANHSLGKGWKNWQMDICLDRLQGKGMLKMDGSGRDYVYYPCCSRKEYISQWMGKGEKLTREEAEKLKKLIN